MAYEIPGFSFTLVAAEDLSSLQFSVVDVDNAGKAITPAADGGRGIGVVQNKPAIGQSATIVTTGVTKVKVGTGGIAAGANAQALTNGTITTAAAGDHAIGIALAAGDAGDIIPLLLTPGGGGALIA